MCKSRLFWWQTQKKCVKQSFKSFTNLSSWVYFGHIYSCVYVCACVYECICVYLGVFVWISVFVWERWRGACEAVARVMTAVKREQLSSSLQELTILPCCLLQKYINFVLLNAHFNVQLASWWLFIQGQCFLPNQGLNDFLFGLANCWQCYCWASLTSDCLDYFF